MPPANKQLGDLPPSKDKFWKKADVRIHELKRIKCKHNFERKSGLDILCSKCGAGYILTSGDFYLKDGHLYKGKKLVI